MAQKIILVERSCLRERDVISSVYAPQDSQSMDYQCARCLKKLKAHSGHPAYGVVVKPPQHYFSAKP